MLIASQMAGKHHCKQRGIPECHLKKYVHLWDAQEDGCHDGLGNT